MPASESDSGFSVQKQVTNDSNLLAGRKPTKAFANSHPDQRLISQVS
jgi:hypothetical protein